MSLTPKIHFYPVKDNGNKIKTIFSLVHEVFSKRKKVLIYVPNQESAQFIDSLLWKYQDDSFIPHAILQSHSDEWVGITQQQINYNKASLLFNLSPSICPLFNQFTEVYELFDMTSSEKREQSQKKLKEYQNLGIGPHQMTV